MLFTAPPRHFRSLLASTSSRRRCQAGPELGGRHMSHHFERRHQTLWCLKNAWKMLHAGEALDLILFESVQFDFLVEWTLTWVNFPNLGKNESSIYLVPTRRGICTNAQWRNEHTYSCNECTTFPKLWHLKPSFFSWTHWMSASV